MAVVVPPPDLTLRAMQSNVALVQAVTQGSRTTLDTGLFVAAGGSRLDVRVRRRADGTVEFRQVVGKRSRTLPISSV